MRWRVRVHNYDCVSPSGFRRYITVSPVLIRHMFMFIVVMYSRFIAGTCSPFIARTFFIEETCVHGTFELYIYKYFTMDVCTIMFEIK